MTKTQTTAASGVSEKELIKMMLDAAAATPFEMTPVGTNGTRPLNQFEKDFNRRLKAAVKAKR